jgi:FkbM family methyltransferase
MLEPYLSPGDGVLDIGAHVGRYTQAYAKVVGTTGRVVAVEPDPESARKLRVACDRMLNVLVFEGMVGPQEWASVGLCAMTRDAEDARRNSVWAANTMKPGAQFLATAAPLDGFLRLFKRLRGIKIDAQGAEAHILDGATETLKRNDLVWAVELWPEGLRNAGRSVREVADIFSAAGYHPVASHGRTWDQLVTLIEPYTGHKSTDVVLTHRES